MTEHASRRREQRRLCIAMAKQRQGQSVHRDGESSAEYACIATARAGQSMHHKSKQLMGQSMHCDCESRPEHASQRQCKSRDRAGERSEECQTMQGYNRATAETDRDGKSSAEYASIRWSNGRDRGCVATARAGSTMHRYGTAATIMHRDHESSVGYPRLAKLFKSRCDQLALVCAHLEFQRWISSVMQRQKIPITCRTEQKREATKTEHTKAQSIELRFLPVRPVHQLQHFRSRGR